MDDIPLNSPIPAFITNPQECPLNSCEVLRIISQHFLIVNSKYNKQNFQLKDKYCVYM